MVTVPMAAFLTGALLTLLMPVALLIALTVWYWLFSVRQPDAADGSEARTPPPAADHSATYPPETGPPAPGA